MTDLEKLGVRAILTPADQLTYDRANRRVIAAWIGLGVVVAAIVMVAGVLVVLAERGVL